MTRGNPLGLSALLSRLNPRNGIITGIVPVSGKAPAHGRAPAGGRTTAGSREVPAIGQIKCVEGRRNARLTFLMPANAHESQALPALLDGLSREAGRWGSFGLLAEVEETAAVYEFLRRAGYSVYAWQQIYHIPLKGRFDTTKTPLWRFAEPLDEISIRQLYSSLVPPLVQAAEPLPSGRLYGLVHRVEDQILAYIESVYGPDGIYLRPLIHPNVANVDVLLQNLEASLSPLLGRKVYMAVRSYQSWLQSPLISMAPDSTEPQALMVKYLGALQRSAINSYHRAIVEEGVEPTVPQMAKKDLN